MIRLVRAEFVKLRTTQVWFWLLLAAVAVTALLVVAQLAPHDAIHNETDVHTVLHVVRRRPTSWCSSSACSA